MYTFKVRAVMTAVAALGLMAFNAQAMPVTQFVSSSEGWVGGGGTAAESWMATGGIGGSGYLKTVDMAGGQMLAISPAFGDQVASLGGLLSFDYNVFALGTGNHYVPNNSFGVVTIYSGGFHVTADLIGNVSVASDIVGTGWHEASLALVGGLWTGNASLATVLANVTQVTIDTEYDTTQRWPDEVVGIDNFAFGRAVVKPAATVPEPPLAALMLVGAGVWAFASRRRRKV